MILFFQRPGDREINFGEDETLLKKVVDQQPQYQSQPQQQQPQAQQAAPSDSAKVCDFINLLLLKIIVCKNCTYLIKSMDDRFNFKV